LQLYQLILFWKFRTLKSPRKNKYTFPVAAMKARRQRRTIA